MLSSAVSSIRFARIKGGGCDEAEAPPPDLSAAPAFNPIFNSFDGFSASSNGGSNGGSALEGGASCVGGNCAERRLMPGPIPLELTGLSKTFQTADGPFVAVENVNALIREGEFVCILGHSG